MFERKIRLGEIISMVVVVFAALGIWFRIQMQVESNTQMINRNIKLMEQLDGRIRDGERWMAIREGRETRP